MTRFARARGSKSSNERLPEEATSWHIMKQQMQEKQKSSSKHEAQTKETRRSLTWENNDITEHEWAVFEEEPVKFSGNKKNKQKNYVSLKTNREISDNEESYTNNKKKLQKVINKNSKVQRKESKLKISKKIKSFAKLAVTDGESNATEDSESHVIQVKKSKKQKKGTQTSNSFQVEDLNIETISNETSISQKKKKKENIKERVNVQSDVPQDNTHVRSSTNNEGEFQQTKHTNYNAKKKFDSKDFKNRNIHKHRKPVCDAPQDDTHVRSSTNNEGEFQQTKHTNYNAKKKFDSRDFKNRTMHKRRKPEPPAVKMFINGKEIEIIQFDGFPVKKEDAERLEELRKKLLDQGIPRGEVVHTMKMERRRAEKALARERKKVCFHCRKAGHFLSECPELGSSTESTTGICFKCGSTEHTHFQCKVTRSQDFRYAECFICKEQGHIARQCPDNPRGLYPKGGACKVCGDVTHLKKDCPDLIKEKEQQTITLGTLDSNSLEVLDEEVKERRNESSQHKQHLKKKTVKF
ncbi:transcriptional regulator ATRX homolog [Periplaneta americana]|uniref:transcriptional regulator ATRX homolog n=1 Tax=Periplaneta americana TaxID=6978 RepID=UPI0037E8DBB4